jgi:hypothetical protein
LDALTGAASTHATFPGVALDVVYLVYEGGDSLPAPYENPVVFTVKAYYASYAMNFVTRSFTVIEYDCSIKFDVVPLLVEPELLPIIYFMNAVLPSTAP